MKQICNRTFVKITHLYELINDGSWDWVLEFLRILIYNSTKNIRHWTILATRPMRTIIHWLVNKNYYNLILTQSLWRLIRLMVSLSVYSLFSLLNVYNLFLLFTHVAMSLNLIFLKDAAYDSNPIKVDLLKHLQSITLYSN